MNCRGWTEHGYSDSNTQTHTIILLSTTRSIGCQMWVPLLSCGLPGSVFVIQINKSRQALTQRLPGAF